MDGTKLAKEYAKTFPGKIISKYSPENFTGTEFDFALEICMAVQKNSYECSIADKTAVLCR